MKLAMIPPVRREMLRAARRYDRVAPGLGDRFLDEVRAGLRAILEDPNGHPPLAMPYCRKLLWVFTFALVYRVEADEIAVVAVASFWRRPGYWKPKMKPKE